MAADLLHQLANIPDHWALVAVGNDKRPYQPEWQKHPISRQQLTAEINAGRAVAIGVIAGPQSGGLLFVDHDGLGASEVLEQIDFRDRTASGTNLMERIRRLFNRAELDQNEVNILRGILTAVQQKRRIAGSRDSGSA